VAILDIGYHHGNGQSREKYFEVLFRFIKRIQGLQPGCLVVVLGLNTAEGDPT